MNSNNINTLSKYSDDDLKNIYENIFKELNDRNININNLQNKYYQHRCYCLFGTSYKIVKLEFIEEYNHHYISENDYETNYTDIYPYIDSYGDGSGEISFDIYTKNNRLSKREKHY